MKKAICDICGVEATPLQEMEVPVKVTQLQDTCATDLEVIDICIICEYKLKLENTLNEIKTIKKLKRDAKKAAIK